MMVTSYHSLHYPVLHCPEVHHQHVGRVLDVGRVEASVEGVEKSSRTAMSCLRSVISVRPTRSSSVRPSTPPCPACRGRGSVHRSLWRPGVGIPTLSSPRLCEPCCCCTPSWSHSVLQTWLTITTTEEDREAVALSLLPAGLTSRKPGGSACAHKTGQLFTFIIPNSRQLHTTDLRKS